MAAWSCNPARSAPQSPRAGLFRALRECSGPDPSGHPCSFTFSVTPTPTPRPRPTLTGRFPTLASARPAPSAGSAGNTASFPRSSSPVPSSGPAKLRNTSPAPLGVPPAEVASFLTSGMSPQVALTELKAYKEFENVLIVGHEPDFSMLIAELLGMPSPEHVSVKKASLTRLSVRRLRVGGACLEFSIPCSLMAPPSPPNPSSESQTPL